MGKSTFAAKRLPGGVGVLILASALVTGGCNEMLGGGIKDVTHNARYEPDSPYRANRVYRLTRDVRLAPDGWLLWFDPAHPSLDKGDVVVSAGTRFRIDRIILDDRIASLQYDPQGVLLDGPYAGRWIDTIEIEDGSAVETTSPE